MALRESTERGIRPYRPGERTNLHFPTRLALAVALLSLTVAGIATAQSSPGAAPVVASNAPPLAPAISPAASPSVAAQKRIYVSPEQLKAMIADAPAAAQALILKTPVHFLELMVKVLQEPSDLIRLVDKQHALPSDYVPPDLVSLNHHDLTLYKSNLFLRRIALPSLLAMVHASRVAGTDLPIASTYRSYSLQKAIFEWNVSTYGLKEAERESAHPGTSQHQLGTAIDFGDITNAFAKTAGGRWIAQHGWEYGFTISYPQGYEQLTGYMYEPWHYRYIGVPAARMMHDYFDDIQQNLLVFLHDHASAFAALLQ